MAEKVIPRMKQLEEETLLFVRSFLNSSYPETVKEAALFNLATLRSQTVFRLPSGHLMGWEGIMDRFGSCQGSCTHVWNYEMATPFCSVVWHRQCAMWSLTMPRKRMG